MSSGTRPQLNGDNVIGVTSSQITGGSAFGMSPRQQRLNRLWAHYCACQYDARRINWDGTPVVDDVERESMASATVVPPGFYDASAGDMPLSLRKPTSPYHLARCVTNRFTGLLFSERSHPVLRVAGDPASEDVIAAIIAQGRLWPQMIKARTYGGAQGSVALTFKFVNGRTFFEVHDPRWCVPMFKDREQLVLQSLEKRYQFQMERRNDEGLLEQQWFWYRRVITEMSDIVYKPQPVDPDGRLPVRWDVSVQIDHRFGEFPGVWIQNTSVDDDIDGESDCHGIYDTIGEIDALVSQANRGIKANCDPTLHIGTDLELTEIKKGSDNAIKAEKGSTVGYVEITGAGIEAAYKAADKLRGWALEVAQCVLDDPGETERTATEVERSYSSMLDKCDIYREQYGQRGVIIVIEKVLRAAKKLNQPVADDAGRLVRQALRLPPKIVRGDDPNQAPTLVQRQIPDRELDGVLDLQWPPYFKPSLNDKKTASEAAAEAKAAKLIDKETASKSVAPFFDVEDPAQMMRNIEQESQSDQNVLGDMMINRIKGMNAAKVASGDKTTAPPVAAALEGGNDGKQQPPNGTGGQ